MYTSWSKIANTKYMGINDNAPCTAANKRAVIVAAENCDKWCSRKEKMIRRKITSSIIGASKRAETPIAINVVKEEFSAIFW